eukprot:16181308-Heterocapsa_arctica.AAC.1
MRQRVVVGGNSSFMVHESGPGLRFIRRDGIVGATVCFQPGAEVFGGFGVATARAGSAQLAP